MTFAELDRALASKRRVHRMKEQEKASFDYMLADLIGQSISRLYGSSNKMPSINEYYSNLFDNEDILEKVQEKKDSLSVARFRQFAQSYNKRFMGVSKDNE